MYFSITCVVVVVGGHRISEAKGGGFRTGFMDQSVSKTKTSAEDMQAPADGVSPSILHLTL